MTVDEIVAGLWTRSGRISQAFMGRLTDLVPSKSRKQFRAKLPKLIREWERENRPRIGIAARVFKELRAAGAKMPRPAFTFDFEIKV